MVLILILGVLVLVKRLTVFDRPQIQLSGIHFEGVRLGLILAIFSYVGYESATALGEEAKRPLVNIPRAVLLSPFGPAYYPDYYPGDYYYGRPYYYYGHRYYYDGPRYYYYHSCRHHRHHHWDDD